jgi:integrase
MNMARRRANHEGTLYRRKDGLWCAQVSLDGHRLTKYGKTQRECHDWIKEMLGKIDTGLTYESTHITLESFINTWLNGKKLSRRERTVFQYRKIAENYILPNLGKMRIQDIRPVHIQRMYSTFKERGTGARTLQLVHAVLHNVLDQAVREGALSHNPADSVERPRWEHKEFKTFTEDEVRQFLLATAGHRHEALFYLALTTGMREGELLGLKWADPDWSKGVLNIQRQLQRIEHKGLFFVPPKTKAGRRQIKLGQGMLDRLAEHRKRQDREREEAGSRWQDNDLIFPSSIGTPFEGHRIWDEFKELLAKAGLPDMRFHDLRHTALSLLMDMGIAVTTIQQRAGHSKASVTTDIYGHSMSRSQEKAAEQIEELITPVAVGLQ